MAAKKRAIPKQPRPTTSRPSAKNAKASGRTSTSRATPRPGSPGTERERVRNLLAIDAANLVRRITKRYERMVEVFGHKRDRTALVEPLESWFGSITFRELVLFRPAEQRAIADFYAAIDELRWYVRHTEDMPGTLATVLESHRRDITDAYEVFRRAIGEPAAPPEPEDVDDLIAEALAAAEVRQKSKRRD